MSELKRNITCKIIGCLLMFLGGFIIWILVKNVELLMQLDFISRNTIIIIQMSCGATAFMYGFWKFILFDDSIKRFIEELKNE